MQRYSTNTKRYPSKKAFGNSEFCSSRQNLSRPNSLENCGFGGENKTQSFQKLFFGGCLFVFVEYLCNRSPKIKTKNIKNYSSILAIVNHRNWLNDSPPLKKAFFLLLQHRKIAKAKKQAFSKSNNCQKNFSIACAEQQSFIILNSFNFACKPKKITEILSF